ncbi:putative capsular polysaccharide synthesis family protein [Moritella yayanosii]|uniref:Uncharacterized protein n=1 Tax=Moritella yayanosii TaxID=69539 RepID=A0A330LTQ8_9GAMM|nr:putative capsular polysaccharide synthesis family protein [Moritella yayanosii]SQD79772.1 conserved protein of unknown function, might involve in Capsular polysaccharide synthesis [Moritella yayanosii]
MKKIFKDLSTSYNKYRNEDAILVYQMGKVGSTSFEQSLPNSIHLHTLFGNSPCYLHQNLRDKYKLGLLKRLFFEFVKRIAIKKRNKIKIISLIREPISRDKSMFFQNIQHWLYKYSEDPSTDIRSEGNEYLVDAFYKIYDFDYGLNWYSREFKKFTGIDVYQYEYNVKEGYTIINEGKFEVLIINLANLNELNAVITNFTGQDISQVKGNSGDKKWYSEVYKAFNKGFVIRTEYREKIQNSIFYRHFFYEKP